MSERGKTVMQKTLKKFHLFQQKHRNFLMVLCLVAVFLAGYSIHGEKRPELLAPTKAQLADLDKSSPGRNEDILYACPMGDIPPRESPGLCPICGMELVAVPKGHQDHEGEPPRIMLTEAAAVMAQVELARVEKKFVTSTVRSFGQIVSSPERIVAGDPSGLMVRLFIYESDYSKIRLGQRLTFETEAYPGRTFKGTIAFIGIVSDSYAKTFTVGGIIDRIPTPLTPGMLVHGRIETILDSSGGVIQGDASASLAPIVIPAAAPLITGERAVVYVAVPGLKRTYEGREIRLGPRTDQYYIVYNGLAVGEQVVMNGAFKIDSAVQIQVRPSMMNPVSAKKPSSGE